MKLRHVVWVAAFVVVAVTQPASADTTSVTPTAALDCTHPIGASAPPRSEVVGGQIALLTSDSRHRAMQAASFSDPALARYRFFAKSPLYVRTGTGSAQIVVPRSERGRIAVSWGNTDHDGTASREFDVGPCAGDGTWVVFPGGYYVTRPHCALLLVRVDDHEREVAIGVGKACPGQRPPPR